MIGYAQLAAQLVHVLRQSGEHDACSCALLVQLLHDLGHVAHAQHLLDVVLVHARILDVLEYFEHGIHTAACLVEHLAQGLRSHADSVSHVEGITPDSRNHSRQCRGTHFHAHTQAADRRTEGGHLVDGDAALCAHGTDALHEVGNLWGGTGTAGTQTVDGRSDFLHSHSRCRRALDGALLQLLAYLVHLARGDGHAHHLRSRLASHFGQGNHQFVCSLGESLHVLQRLQAQLSGTGGDFHE